MKKDDPPHRNPRTPRLTPELTRFIAGMGLYFENQGIPRIGGRILGLLMIADQPLSAEDLASVLQVSRGSISTNFRMLLPSGMVEKVALPGDRNTYYKFSDMALEQRVVTGIESTRAFKRLAEQGLSAMSSRDPARHHLDASIEWSDLIVETFQKTLSEWRQRRAKLARTVTARPASAGKGV